MEGRPPGRPWMRRFLKRIGLCLGAAILLMTGGWFCLRFVPLPGALFAPPVASVEFFDRTGLPLREQLADEKRFSRPFVFDDIPPSLIDATLAAEDKRFWSHHGVDVLAVLRSAGACLRHGRVVCGGSTITQQLVKISNPRPRTLRAKCVEALQALRLEQVWDKHRILTEYLNRAPYGNLRVGCAAAARYYFGKPLADLSLAECAFLAGLPQSPSRLNPHRHFDRAAKRGKWILQRMKEDRLIDDARFLRAKREPLRLCPPGRLFEAPHAVDLILAQQMEDPDSLSDRRCHTTLDLELNRVVEQTLRVHMERLSASHAQNAAAVILDNRSGDVLALVGSENYFAPGTGQVNGAWAPRSAGSTLKPFTYAMAFERGANPATIVADVACEFMTPTGVFRPVNYNHHFYGPVRYRLALANSLNVSAVKILQTIGGPAFLHERLRQCGLTTLDKPAEHYGLGLTIGNAEVRLLELVNAYACLARLGVWRPCRLTPCSFASSRASRRLFDETACYLIADILTDNDARTLAFGAHSALRFDYPVACKTGTSSDFRDNWAVGFTPEFTVGVWVGNFDGSPMERVSGVTGAAPILNVLFEHLRARHSLTWYVQPADVVQSRIDPVIGKQVGKGGGLEKFSQSHLPPFVSPDDFDASGRIRLGTEYRNWLASGDNWLSGGVIAVNNGREKLRIVSPLPGSVFYLDPDLPSGGCILRLKCEPVAGVQWRSDTLRIESFRGETRAQLKEGIHHLRAVLPGKTGVCETWIEVRQM